MRSMWCRCALWGGKTFFHGQGNSDPWPGCDGTAPALHGPWGRVAPRQAGRSAGLVRPSPHRSADRTPLLLLRATSQAVMDDAIRMPTEDWEAYSANPVNVGSVDSTSMAQ